jgi:CDGSH-type Zn-finger protein
MFNEGTYGRLSTTISSNPIVKNVKEAWPYCRCTRTKNPPFCDGSCSHEHYSAHPEFDDRRPSPSAAAGDPRIIPIATALMDAWSKPKEQPPRSRNETALNDWNVLNDCNLT